MLTLGVATTFFGFTDHCACGKIICHSLSDSAASAQARMDEARWTKLIEEFDWDNGAVVNHVVLKHRGHKFDIYIIPPGVTTLKELQAYLRAYFLANCWTEWENDDLVYSDKDGPQVVSTANLQAALKSGILTPRNPVGISKEFYEAHLKAKVGNIV